ncbi:MAG: DUF6076 domain-containing protein [Ruminococcus sp.]|nr:DUF6076 domain-containing protein [Ruminococcus sp.]
MDKDYSKYELSEHEKYKYLRSNNKNITYDSTNNYVSFFPLSKLVKISVNTQTSFANLYDIIENEGTPEQLDRLAHQFDDEESVAAVKCHKEKIEAETKRLYKKYNVENNRNARFEEDFYESHPEIDYVPPGIVLSGCIIDRPLGEGILEYIYADFQSVFKNEYLIGVMLLENPDLFDFAKDLPEVFEKSPPQTINNSFDEMIEEYLELDSSCDTTRLLAAQSLYTIICPPYLKENIGIRDYYFYLRALQREYLEILKFCFDENYYPELLGNLTPAERYYTYRQAKDLPSFIERNDELYMAFSPLLNEKNEPDFRATIDRVKSVFPEDKLSELAQELGTSNHILSLGLRGTHRLSKRYRFSTVAEILELELSIMLENDIRFRKCQRCGKYFIMKGNYDTRYCDRIADGETRSCQELAAQDNYKKKSADNKALPIYSKYYKRYAARVKVRQIKETDFKKWKYEALIKRDECTAGKITPEEYINWLESCFPNRKRRNKQA